MDKLLIPSLVTTATESIYGTDRVGSKVTGGVNLVGKQCLKEISVGLRGGMTGYAYASPTASFES